MNKFSYVQDSDIDYKDYWDSDIKYINKAVFISGPNDNIENTKNFKMNIPCYLWDLPIDFETYQEQHISNLINLFLTKCSEEDHKLLMLGNYYLRMLQYQDKPMSDRYVYIYLRSIENCTFESHKLSLKSIHQNKLTCEITYSKRGFFYEFSIDEWKIKHVNHIAQFV